MVTGRAGLKAVKPPTGSACATESRVSDPPCRARHPASSASLSTVTALTTSRPPGSRAAQHASSTPGTVAPPPTNTASGRGSPASASGARPATTCSPGTPSRRALAPTRAARSGCDSTATARHDGCTRIHSMPIEPAPAPTSHSSRPGSGASRARVTARTSRLVSCPSWA
jgi:hypothetical protein